MEPEELARHIADRYKATSLVRRFGKGDLSNDLTKELEYDITLVVTELVPISNLENLTLAGHSAVDFLATDEGEEKDGIVYFGDIAFKGNRVLARRDGDWKTFQDFTI